MIYKQLISPDLNTQGEVGKCLNFAERSYGTPIMYDNATEAWNATQFKHPNQDFPSGVAVLLWWSYWTTINGVFADYGHVASRLPDGRIFSSPYRVGTGQAFLNSIDELQRIYSNNGQHPLIYRGWTEDIATVRVVKEDNMNGIPEDSDIINFKRSDTGVPDYQPTGDEFRHYKAPENGFKALGYDMRAGMQAQIDKLKAQSNGGTAYKEVGSINGIPIYEKL